MKNEKISVALKEYYKKHGHHNTGVKFPDERRKNISLSRKGKHLSEQHKNSLSIAAIKRFANPEERRKASERLLRNGMPEEAILKRSKTHSGSGHRNWQGGITKERQKLINSKEWKQVVSIIWKRDKATCQKCGITKKDYIGDFDIHHITSFVVKELRTEPENLILFCEKCHNFIHSKKNINKEFINDNKLRF